MKVDPNSILPSQDFLKPNTVRFISECIEKGEMDELPPDPIVRANHDGRLIAIDGHNLIAKMCDLGELVEVHPAESADDGLPETSEANRLRNIDLANKFDSVVDDQARVEAEGITSFKDLIAKYPELF